MEEKIPIYVIYVKPRNNTYCEYIINDEMVHSKKYDELAIYLGTLLPEKAAEIGTLIDLRRHFLIFLQDKEIQELKFDSEAETKSLRDKVRFEDMEKVQNNKFVKPKTRDEIIKAMSNKNNSPSSMDSICKKFKEFNSSNKWSSNQNINSLFQKDSFIK